MITRKKSDLLFSELPFTVHHCLKNSRFLPNIEMKIMFLVRHPALSMVSAYKINPDVDVDWIDYRFLTKLESIAKSRNIPLLKLRSEDILRKPSDIYAKACNFLNIDFDAEHLIFKSKVPDHWTGCNCDWYQRVASSKTIDITDEVYCEPKTFEFGIFSKNHRESWVKMFLTNLDTYENFLTPSNN